MIKTIFEGWLQFGSAKSFDKVLRTYLHRKDIYYKNDALFDEEIFNEEKFGIIIPRSVQHCTDKNWRTTIDMLKFAAQFAVEGKVDAWIVDKGRVIKHACIEPDNDRSTVRDFIKSKQIIEEGKDPEEAHDVLTTVIEKYKDHAMAYERRGYVNFLLNNYSDAKRDFNKSLKIIPNHAEAYYGRARVNIETGKIQEAIDDLAFVYKYSVAVQPLYWQARRIKGELHVQLEQWEDAAKEFKLFVNKTFSPDNPNYSKATRVKLEYARVLYKLERFNEALELFSELAELEGEETIDIACEALCYKGNILKSSGKQGYKRTFERANELNSAFAEKLMLQLV